MNIKYLKQSEVKSLRDKLAQEQNNKCLICNSELETPVLDHSHQKYNKGTGLIRGVLCRTCNIFIAKSENNCIRYGISHDTLPDILRSMAKYLEKEHHPFLHPTEVPKNPKLKKSSYNKLVREAKKQGIKKKIPKYTGNYTKVLQELYERVGLDPEFYDS